VLTGHRGKPTEGGSRAAAVAALACAAILALSACGSSSTKSGSAGTNSSGSTSAASNAALTDTSVTAAKTLTDPLLQRPSSIGLTQPLSAKPPSGKRIALVGCNLAGCEQYYKDMQAAVKVLGWTVTFYPEASTPESVVAALQSAAATKPDGLVTVGVTGQGLAAAAGALKAANVPIVGGGFISSDISQAKAAVGNLLVNVTSDETIESRQGKSLGAWMVADSKGKTNVLNVTYSEFPILVQTDSAAIQAGVKQYCSTCNVTTLPVSASTAGSTLPSVIVSNLQSHPQINYVCLEDGSMVTGLVAALADAGLQNKLKIVGTEATPAAAAEVVQGKEYGWANIGTEIVTYQDLDALARHFVGDPQVSYGATEPIQIFTKSSFGAAPTSASILDDLEFTGILNQWATLWRES